MHFNERMMQAGYVAWMPAVKGISSLFQQTEKYDVLPGCALRAMMLPGDAAIRLRVQSERCEINAEKERL
jgi:hypothetical protein